MTSTAVSRTKSTNQDKKRQIVSDLSEPLSKASSVDSVNLAEITGERHKESTAKKSKSLRVERHLLSRTEELRGHTNLNFNEYVETALRYFNDCLDQQLSEQSQKTNDAA